MDSVKAENFYYLSKAKYVEEKREILVEFSHPEGKISKKFPFFPQLFIRSDSFSDEILKQVFSAFGKKIAAEKNSGFISFRASTFSDLKALSNFLLSSFKIDFFLIEPERQFLIEKNWHYFDAFRVFENELQQSAVFSIPNPKLDFFAEPLAKTLEELYSLEPKNSKALAESIVLSKNLFLPLNSLPEKLFDSAEIFLENNFFREKIFPKREKFSRDAGMLHFPPNGVFSDVAELDFFNVWLKVFSKNFWNLGFESLNCSCCEPLTIFDKNLLSNSLVKVRFLEDGFYFESFSKAFSEKFHKSNPFSEKRLRHKKEFFLQFIPVGPFFKNNVATITLHDALALSAEKKLEIISLQEKNWFCAKKESFISGAFCGFALELSEIDSILSKIEFSGGEKGFFSSPSSKNDFEKFYFSCCKNFLADFSRELLFHLNDKNSKFYSPRLSDSVDSVKELFLFKFRKFGEKNSTKAIHFTQNRAFVESKTPLILVKEFAFSEKLPVPEIRALHKKIVF